MYKMHNVMQVKYTSIDLIQFSGPTQPREYNNIHCVYTQQGPTHLSEVCYAMTIAIVYWMKYDNCVHIMVYMHVYKHTESNA